jgi:hypothetical protein
LWNECFFYFHFNCQCQISWNHDFWPSFIQSLSVTLHLWLFICDLFICDSSDRAWITYKVNIVIWGGLVIRGPRYELHLTSFWKCLACTDFIKDLIWKVQLLNASVFFSCSLWKILLFILIYITTKIYNNTKRKSFLIHLLWNECFFYFHFQCQISWNRKVQLLNASVFFSCSLWKILLFIPYGIFQIWYLLCFQCTVRLLLVTLQNTSPLPTCTIALSLFQ